MKIAKLIVLQILGIYASASQAGECDLKPLATNFSDRPVMVTGIFSVSFLGAAISNSGGEPSDNCVFRATATGKPSPRSFIEEGFDTFSSLQYSITLKSVDFLPQQPGKKDTQKLGFYSMGFTGSEPIALMISAQSLSVNEFTLLVEVENASGVQPLIARNVTLGNFPDAKVMVQWSQAGLSVGVGGIWYSVPGQVRPETSRFGSLKEQSVMSGSSIAFSVASTCFNTLGQPMQSCKRKP
jgi:hypothetical protein